MIALAVAMILAGPTWTPGPNDPVCQPGQVVEVDHCSQGQLPGEVVGRQIDGPSPSASQTPPAPTTPPEPAPAAHLTVLAYTGVPEGPYAAVGFGALLAGAGAVAASRRACR